MADGKIVYTHRIITTFIQKVTLNIKTKKKKKLPTSGVGPPTFRLQGERNNHYATQAYILTN